LKAKLKGSVHGLTYTMREEGVKRKKRRDPDFNQFLANMHALEAIEANIQLPK